MIFFGRKNSNRLFCFGWTTQSKRLMFPWTGATFGQVVVLLEVRYQVLKLKNNSLILAASTPLATRHGSPCFAFLGI
jgi:hypothetical protein